MDYFGRLYPSDAFKAGQQKPTPVGDVCGWCFERIAEGDSGTWTNGGLMAWHLECFIRSIVGSVAHQQKRCLCYGGTEEEPENMPRREAARAAFEECVRSWEKKAS